MRSRYNTNSANRDSNQPEIVEAFEKSGCTVRDTTNVGNGFPDLVVGFGGQNWLVEVKQEKGKLKDSQVVFAESWGGGHVYIVRRPEQVSVVMDLWRGVSSEVEVIEPDQFRQSGVL